jgi:hypothetical protein
MSLSSRPLRSARTELHTAISAMCVSESDESPPGDNLRVLFICRDTKQVYDVAVAASKLWQKELDNALPGLFYDAMKASEKGSTNHCVFVVILLIFVSEEVRKVFSQSPFSAYFFAIAKDMFYKMIMGLTEDGTFCRNSKEKICHGIAEYVMRIRIRYLSI